MIPDQLSYIQAYQLYLRELAINHTTNTVRSYTNSIDKYYQFLLSQNINLDSPVSNMNIALLPAFINEVIKLNIYSKSTISLLIAGLKSYHKWLRVNKFRYLFLY
jgi:site-specific recombinase XerD